jgi:catechol 2,3-dioxygenase-like lactoylglutathione lyase family enzyme
MIGYGAEDDHFVVELTYNYGIDKYKLGNDFVGITIASSKAVERARLTGAPGNQTDDKQCLSIQSPEGYQFHLLDQDLIDIDPVMKISINCRSLERSMSFWKGLLGMTLVQNDKKGTAVLKFSSSHIELELIEIGIDVDHGTAYGRIAFAVPEEYLERIEFAVKECGNRVLTPLVRLDTPWKATVAVVIVADPVFPNSC